MEFNYSRVDDNKVICSTTYHDTYMYATATCHPEDEFDYEKGCKIARARLEVKIRTKRVKELQKRRKDMYKKFDELTFEQGKMVKDLVINANSITAAWYALDDAQDELYDIEDGVGKYVK